LVLLHAKVVELHVFFTFLGGFGGKSCRASLHAATARRSRCGRLVRPKHPACARWHPPERFPCRAAGRYCCAEWSAMHFVRGKRAQHLPRCARLHARACFPSHLHPRTLLRRERSQIDAWPACTHAFCACAACVALVWASSRVSPVGGCDSRCACRVHRSGVAGELRTALMACNVILTALRGPMRLRLMLVGCGSRRASARAVESALAADPGALCTS